MNISTEFIALLALFISLASLSVSIYALLVDRHAVSARAVPVQNETGNYNLHVTAINSGKRPISITHTLLLSKSSPGLYLNFGSSGVGRIDVGQSQNHVIEPTIQPITWNTSEQLREIDVFVVDAIGKKHHAKWEGHGIFKARCRAVRAKFRRWTNSRRNKA